MNTSELQTTLSHLVHSRAGANPAFDALLHDYAEYHAVLVVLGGLATLGLLLLSVFCWRRFRRAPIAFERRTFLAFALSSAVVGLCTALIVLANLSTVLHPRQGLSGAIPMLGGTEQARVHQAANEWLKSGRSALPPLLERKIDDRLSWQRPKAIVCGLLLIVFVVFCVRWWSRLIASARVRWAAIATGAFGVACTLLLMVMAIANTQASFAPLTLTLLYG